ncbi:hypothetical protein SEA_RIZWANA_9 [Arthrobacter phage Rizwana]|nr:hypothetical protein SEA_RIZWANA_9 [Arthrobacter phage Rizwana]
MPRTPLGAAAKDKVAGTRITKAEEKALIAKFGSTSKALRYFIDKWHEEELAK